MKDTNTDTNLDDAWVRFVPLGLAGFSYLMPLFNLTVLATKFSRQVKDYPKYYWVALRYLYIISVIVMVAIVYLVFAGTYLEGTVSSFLPTNTQLALWISIVLIVPMIHAFSFKLYGDAVIAFDPDFIPPDF